MKNVVLIIAITISSLAAYCQHPYKQSLGSIAQITFPDTPKVEFGSRATYYACKDNSSDIFFAQVTDFQSDTLQLKTIKSVYSAFIWDVLKPLKGELLNKKEVQFGKLRGVSFNFKCNLKGTGFYGYENAFLIDEHMVSYSLLSPDSIEVNDKKLRSYFDSFVTSPEKAADLDGKSGILAGVIMFCGIVFWTLVVIFVVKRVKKKKTYTWPE
ncbi:MAG TPA: hypothetical protein VHE59_19760 [Mucilaginibacter sp.]|nr:hypothetical protein [Mucilaginibacter sp.]